MTTNEFIYKFIDYGCSITMALVVLLYFIVIVVTLIRGLWELLS